MNINILKAESAEKYIEIILSSSSKGLKNILLDIIFADIKISGWTLGLTFKKIKTLKKLNRVLEKDYRASQFMQSS